MSMHWRPDQDVVRARLGAGKRLPDGAAAGLLLVAAACAGMAVALYQVLGPREVVVSGAENHLVELQRR